MKQSQQGEVFESINIQHGENTMRLMLDGNDTLKEVEFFIKGYYVQPKFNEQTQQTEYEKVIVGAPKANNRGVQSMMFFLKTKITPLTSLSNISTDLYGDIMVRTRISLASDLMIQLHNYEVSLANYSELLNILMGMVETFLTSAITGGHRRAFTSNQETKRVENTVEQKGKLFGVI